MMSFDYRLPEVETPMLKEAGELLAPDPRGATICRGEIAAQPATLQDLHGIAARLKLDNSVPAHIRDQFDKALNAIVYSWFSSGLATLGELQAFTVLEMAVRERLMSGGTSVPRNMGRLLREADARGWLGESGKWVADNVPRMRNELAFGTTNRDPSLDGIRMCRDLIHCIFNSKQILAQPVPDQAALENDEWLSKPPRRN
jgi:hypothetical protein